jgi:hypothetical protein
MKTSKTKNIVVDAPVSKTTPAHVALGIAVKTFEVGLIDRKFKQLAGKLGENEVLHELIEAESVAAANAPKDATGTLPESMTVVRHVYKMLNARKTDDRPFEFQEFWDGIDREDITRVIMFFRQGKLIDIDQIQEILNPK